MAEIASNRKPTLWAIFYFFPALGAGGAAFFGAAVGASAFSTTTPHVAGMQVEQVLGRQVRTRQVRTRQVLGSQVEQVLGSQVEQVLGRQVRTRQVLGLQVTGSQVLGAQVLGRQVRTRQVRTRQVLGLQVLGAQVTTGAHVEQVLTAQVRQASASVGLTTRVRPTTATKTAMPIKNERFIRKSSKKQVS